MVKKKLKNGSGKENQPFNLFKEFRFKSSKLKFRNYTSCR